MELNRDFGYYVQFDMVSWHEARFATRRYFKF